MSTQDFYDKNANDYFQKTINAPNLSNLEKFRKLLPTNSFVCDLGCGSGRDSLYFKENGFNVLPIDYSSGLINCAKAQNDLEIIQKDFRTIDYEELFDGIWANASLLHLTRAEFIEIIPKLYKSLKPYGFMYISLKPVINKNNSYEESLIEERFFTKYSLSEIKSILNKLNISIKESWITDSTIEENQNWINIIIQKTNSI